MLARLVHGHEQLKGYVAELDHRLEHLPLWSLAPGRQQELSKHVELLEKAVDSLQALLQLPPQQPSAGALQNPAKQDPATFTHQATPQPSVKPGPAESKAAWADLPLELLSAILRPAAVGSPVRAVCKRFRDVFDAAVTTVTLHPTLPAAFRGSLPPVPGCAQTVKLDLSDLPLANYIGPMGWCSLASALKRWPVEAPLLLDFKDCSLKKHDLRRLADLLRCPTFAAGGLQALELSMSDIPDVAPQFAAAIHASQQLSALRELRMACCNLDGGKRPLRQIYDALAAATHICNLAVLELSFNWLAVEGLAACLQRAKHLTRSLKQLLLDSCGMNDDDVEDLVEVITKRKIKLTHISASCNTFTAACADAWADALRAKCLAGLEKLRLDGNRLGDDGITTIANALQAARHMSALRKLALFPNECSEASCAALERLLSSAPHLTASLQELRLPDTSSTATSTRGRRYAKLQVQAMASLPRLRRLQLGDVEEGEAGEAILRQLRTATHLSSLQKLTVFTHMCKPHDHDALFAALVASTHLSGLRKLEVGHEALQVQHTRGLLRQAPHLRGLTVLKLTGAEGAEGDNGGSSLAGLCATLELLPALRSLSVAHVRISPADDMEELAGALQHAACSPLLQELSVSWGRAPAKRASCDAAVMHLALALQASTRLVSLRRLELHAQHPLSEGAAGWLGDALAASHHLMSLQKLTFRGLMEQRIEHVLYERLAGSPLAGVQLLM